MEKKLKKVELESRNCCNLVSAGRGDLMLERDPQISLLSWQIIPVIVKGSKLVAYPVSMLPGAFFA